MYHTVHINTSAPFPAQSSVLMIYTGGTFGMIYDKNKQLVPFEFGQILEKMPELYQFDCLLTVVAFEKPIDSANITPQHWIELARIIEENYEKYDGFVILHGTDTMAFSASALSFLLEGLNKPVVFTGAQLPIGAVRTDARVNLLTALEIASATSKNKKFIVPEVCIFFDELLLRGNRAKKVESSHFDAFQSENYPFLAKVGINIEFDKNAILPLCENNILKTQKSLSPDVIDLRLFPGIQRKAVENILRISDLKGVVLETYGSGNAPTDSWLVGIIKEIIDNGVFVLNVSQCNGGRVVQGRYATSKHLQEVGVLSGADITYEAAITKMMFVLDKKLSKTETEKMLVSSLRGEIYA